MFLSLRTCMHAPINGLPHLHHCCHRWDLKCPTPGAPWPIKSPTYYVGQKRWPGFFYYLKIISWLGYLILEVSNSPHLGQKFESIPTHSSGETIDRWWSEGDKLHGGFEVPICLTVKIALLNKARCMYMYMHLLCLWWIICKRASKSNASLWFVNAWPRTTATEIILKHTLIYLISIRYQID